MKIDIAPFIFAALSPRAAYLELSKPNVASTDPSVTTGNRFAYRKFFVGTPTESDVRRTLESIRSGMAAFGKPPVVFGFRVGDQDGVRGVSFVGYSEIVVDDDKIAPGHNPDRLTSAQVGDGYKLLEKYGAVIPEDADMWLSGRWRRTAIAGELARGATFRVKIKPGSLPAPGYNPYVKKITVAEVGEGYRLLEEGDSIPKYAEIWGGPTLGWENYDYWTEFSKVVSAAFRVPINAVAPGHNLPHLTNEQVGTGFRLLNFEELLPEGSEIWTLIDGQWAEYSISPGEKARGATFRVPLDHIAIGSNPHKLTVSQVGAGFRLLRIGENIPSEAHMYVGSYTKNDPQWASFSVLAFSGPVTEGMTFRVPVNEDTTSNLRDSYPEVAAARAKMKEAGEAHQAALDAYNEALKSGWERAKRETGYVSH